MTTDADTLLKEHDLPLLVIDASTSGSILDIRFVDTQEGGCLHQDTTTVANLTPTAHYDTFKPPSFQEFFKEQLSVSFCQVTFRSVETPHSDFSVYKHGLSVLCFPVNECIRAVVPQLFRQRVLYLSHYPPIAEHPGQRRMYDSLRREFYWPYMAHDAYTTLDACKSCTISNTRYIQKRLLQVCLPSGSLDFVAMDILDTLPCTANKNQQIIVIADWYSKQTRAIPTAKITTTHVANDFPNQRVVLYGIPTYLLTDSGPQFASTIFATICTYHVYCSQTFAYHGLSSVNKRSGKALQQNHRDALTTIRSKAQKRLRYLRLATHVCVQHTGSSLNQHHAIQPCSKQAPTGTSTALH